MIELKEAEMEAYRSPSEWEKVIEYLRHSVDQETITTWFLPLRCQSVENGKVTLAAPSDFFRMWISSNYHDQIKSALKAVFRNDVTVEFVTMPGIAADRPTPDIVLPDASSASDAGVARPEVKQVPSFPRMSRLNPKYTFDQYVVGESNRFAHAACKQVAEPSSRSYNPLFLYGGVGLGKTHLLHAIGHQLLTSCPTMKVLYVTSDEFMNSFIESISQGKQFEFRDYYRKVDLLMIDDVQFFSGKERTQIEFFHTFNALYDAGKKIVISSDRPPNELDALEDRLRNRFAWGLIVDIQPPDLETRIAILRKKAALAGEPELPLDVAAYIAERVQSNIRELEGVLLRLRAYASVMKLPITLELARSVLSNVMSQMPRQTVDLEQIIQLVCERFEIKREDLLGKSRQKQFATPRHIAQYLARKFTKLSYPEIGKRFGGRDHTSVLHAYQRISEEIQKDENMRSLISYLTHQLTTEMNRKL
jgi:chromosomal replication initiator protein